MKAIFKLKVGCPTSDLFAHPLPRTFLARCRRFGLHCCFYLLSLWERVAVMEWSGMVALGWVALGWVVYG